MRSVNSEEEKGTREINFLFIYYFYNFNGVEFKENKHVIQTG